MLHDWLILITFSVMPCLYTVQCATTVSTVNKACSKPIFTTLSFAYRPCVCADKPLTVCVCVRERYCLNRYVDAVSKVSV